mmetsp:Transcript_31279/g.85955  ORF Transcript_31279/g.85955 Transcript_31279/m.85955 type:complete len:222 (-) Transcript_31279:677-1342(-)
MSPDKTTSHNMLGFSLTTSRRTSMSVIAGAVTQLTVCGQNTAGANSNTNEGIAMYKPTSIAFSRTELPRMATMINSRPAEKREHRHTTTPTSSAWKETPFSRSSLAFTCFARIDSSPKQAETPSKTTDLIFAGLLGNLIQRETMTCTTRMASGVPERITWFVETSMSDKLKLLSAMLRVNDNESASNIGMSPISRTFGLYCQGVNLVSAMNEHKPVKLTNC